MAGPPPGVPRAAGGPWAKPIRAAQTRVDATDAPLVGETAPDKTVEVDAQGAVAALVVARAVQQARPDSLVVPPRGAVTAPVLCVPHPRPRGVVVATTDNQATAAVPVRPTVPPTGHAVAASIAPLGATRETIGTTAMWPTPLLFRVGPTPGGPRSPRVAGPPCPLAAVRSNPTRTPAMGRSFVTPLLWVPERGSTGRDGTPGSRRE